MNDLPEQLPLWANWEAGPYRLPPIDDRITLGYVLGYLIRGIFLLAMLFLWPLIAKVIILLIIAPVGLLVMWLAGTIRFP